MGKIEASRDTQLLCQYALNKLGLYLPDYLGGLVNLHQYTEKEKNIEAFAKYTLRAVNNSLWTMRRWTLQPEG